MEGYAVQRRRNKIFSGCHAFYFEKTHERVQKYLKKYPDDDRPEKVNGRSTPGIQEILKSIPWKKIEAGLPRFFHGDLQFDNILYDEASKQFTLIDWRQDFANLTTLGDVYYDFAKLLGGILLPYDYVKMNLIQFKKDDHGVFFDYPQRQSKDGFIRILKRFAEEMQLDFSRIELLTGLIYVNMAPLHHAPFDQMLWALGKTHLDNALNRTP